mgnify:CR=1 FL=1
MPYVLARHRVEDYAKWKSGFDEHVSIRQAASSKGGYVFRNIDDPNEILVLLEYDDLEKFRQFMQSEELREAMQRAGIVDQPDIYFLEEADRPVA